MDHIRQSRPDFGIRVQVKVLIAFQIPPFLLGGGSLEPRGVQAQFPGPYTLIPEP